MVAPQYGAERAYSDLSIGYQPGWLAKNRPYEVVNTELTYNHMINEFIIEKDHWKQEAIDLAANTKGKKQAVAQTSRPLKINLKDIRSVANLKMSSVNRCIDQCLM
jgi:hypothetical protein